MTWFDIPWNPPARTLRQFAGLLCGFCAVVAVLQWRAEQSAPAIIVASLGVMFGVAGIFVPRILRFVFVGWLVIVAPIGWLVLHACLALVYFGVLTPLGLYFRLRGRDTLHLHHHPERNSYWETKVQARPNRYYRTF